MDFYKNFFDIEFKRVFFKFEYAPRNNGFINYFSFDWLPELPRESLLKQFETSITACNFLLIKAVTL